MNCFFTKTVRPACRHLASSQTAIIITRSPGFEYIHAGKHSFECVDTPDTHRLAASVFFTSPMQLDVGVRLNKADILEPEEEPGQVEVLLDREFPCGHLHLSEKRGFLQTVEEAPINPLWWSLAETEYTSNMASTCGCH